MSCSKTSTTERSHKSNKTSSRSHKTSSSFQKTETAILEAAIRRTELQCRKEELEKRIALEKEAQVLQLKLREFEDLKDLLRMDTELKIEDTKIELLEKRESNKDPGSSVLSQLPQSDGRTEVKQWLETYGHNRSHRSPDRMEDHAQHSLSHDNLEHDIRVPVPTERNIDNIQLNDRTHNTEDRATSVKEEIQAREKKYTDGMCENYTHVRRSEPTSRMEDIMMKQNDLTRLLAEHQLKATLPQHRILQFNGDCLQYASFIKSFELGVENKTRSSVDRLHYLDQYTTGEPNNLVKGCLLFDDPEVGYHKAKELLKKTFGNSHKIAESFMRKSQAWPEIKPEDATELNRFSLYMIECLTMMKSLKALSELNHTKNIQALVSKLPYRLKISWRNTACRIDEEEERRVEFEDFVRFVERQARILTNPTFGKIEHKRNIEHNQPNNKFNKSVSKRGAFAVSVEEKTCLFCGENSKHILKECRKFERQDHKSKSEFCFKNSLCFGCLKSGHMKRKCPQLEKCEKCKRNHPTILHIDDFKREMTQQATDKQPPIETKTSCLGLTEKTLQGNNNPFMAVVPVVVKLTNADTTVATYAFLDDGCGAVFVEPSLCEMLRAKTRKRNLLLRTLNSTEVINSAIVDGGMLVAGIDPVNYINLPEVYVKADIPVTENDMPTQDDINRYPHLSQLHVPELYGDIIIPKVTIMIG